MRGLENSAEQRPPHNKRGLETSAEQRMRRELVGIGVPSTTAVNLSVGRLQGNPHKTLAVHLNSLRYQVILLRNWAG